MTTLTDSPAAVGAAASAPFGFQLSDDQLAVRKMVREFAESEIAPHVMEWDEAQTFPHGVIRALGDLGEESSAKRLLAAAEGSESGVALVYLAPEGGSDLYTALKDIDRILDADLGAALDSYRMALQMLGPMNGLRLEVSQKREELASTLQSFSGRKSSMRNRRESASSRSTLRSTQP